MRCDDRMGLEICRGGKISAAAENSGFVKMSTALALFWFCRSLCSVIPGPLGAVVTGFCYRPKLSRREGLVRRGGTSPTALAEQSAR